MVLPLRAPSGAALTCRSRRLGAGSGAFVRLLPLPAQREYLAPLAFDREHRVAAVEARVGSRQHADRLAVPRTDVLEPEQQAVARDGGDQRLLARDLVADHALAEALDHLDGDAVGGAEPGVAHARR